LGLVRRLSRGPHAAPQPRGKKQPTSKMNIVVLIRTNTSSVRTLFCASGLMCDARGVFMVYRCAALRSSKRFPTTSWTTGKRPPRARPPKLPWASRSLRRRVAKTAVAAR
jgi:hypothetical protein